MILELLASISFKEREELISRLQRMGFHVVDLGELRLALVSGIDSLVLMDEFKYLPGVVNVYPLTNKFKLASRQAKAENTVIEINGVKIGGDELFAVAGPCSIESEAQLMECAKVAQKSGAKGLRGGAYKPRTSPYEFQGMGLEGFKLISKVAKMHGLLSVSEVMDIDQVHEAAPLIDILQIGARNVQNYSLLKELGKVKNPILLKRGFATTYQELLMSAEYIMVSGNPNVILCERGIRTFESFTRNTLDLTAVPALQSLTHLPVVVDPSHGTGVRSLVSVMARASVAAGASGILVEMHPDPDRSISDAAQTLHFATFEKMMSEVSAVHNLVKQFA
jgi:3-deoxy-7-phosphoheptulonate synthase